ncbi:uroporphyrinogen-III synthase [Sanguibacter sp. A246]|uniref:uroporphyrinogen-III synthase n=1 Tax=Sanguibacter sp. A246 TaxID=3457326 RepID=UPI003FD7DBBD
MAEPSGPPVRVLVPRGGRPGRELADALAAAGYVPLVAPLITFGPPVDTAPLLEGVVRLAAGEYDWLVLTSERTVDALVDTSSQPGVVQVPAVTRTAAVGPSTARRARRAGIDVDIVPEWDRTATGLLAALTAPNPSDSGSGRSMRTDRRSSTRVRAFAPRSAIARPELVDGLRAAGWLVDAPDAYTTELATSLPAAARDVDVVVLTSSSTAETWATLTAHTTDDTAARQLIVSIGPRTTATARTLGLRVDAEATTPDVPALVAAIDRTPRLR